VTAREEMLGRIRVALGPAAGAADQVPRAYRTGAGLDPLALISLLTDRLHDYGTAVRRCWPSAAPAGSCCPLASTLPGPARWASTA
jgi:L-lactate dehydrogenase complex protein LldG